MQQIPLWKHATEVSPWLELTRWPEYVGTCDLVAAAALGALPDPSQEPLLVLLVETVPERRAADPAVLSYYQRPPDQ
jgi:hypothetical protein